MSLKEKRVGYFFDEELSAFLSRIENHTSACPGTINLMAKPSVDIQVLSILKYLSQYVCSCTRPRNVVSSAAACMAP